MSRPHRTRNFSSRSSTVISVPVGPVRQRIGAWETWPEWQSEILSTEQPRWTEPREVVHGKARLLGFDVHGRNITLSAEERFIEQDVVVGVRMRISYTLEERAGSTQVTHHLDADLPGGLAGRLLSALLSRRLKKMQADLLKRLKDQLEELP